MTREQWLRNQIRSLEQHIRDEVNQARLSFFQDVLERQQKRASAMAIAGSGGVLAGDGSQ